MKISNLKVSFMDKIVFDNFNLEVQTGTTLCVLGGSGVGKTTLLKAIAGIVNYTGNIECSGKISYVFQEDRLIPNISIKSNLSLIMQSQIKDKEERLQYISSMLERLELKDCLDMYPDELSGGMAQRVSMARAFLYDSDILLMDEPFKALDLCLKDRLIDTFNKGIQAKKRTVICVTHDIYEALMIADRIIVVGESPCQILLDIDMPLQENRDAFAPEMDDIKCRIVSTLKIN